MITKLYNSHIYYTENRVVVVPTFMLLGHTAGNHNDKLQCHQRLQSCDHDYRFSV